ncbi:UbiA family prenyltransferase [Luteolibacter pohnpeiensis]|uniref:UbiA family prenyltransferase n=1 Tax=Luteolibacter pohnpeiensis TaxID=454153 RepID=A0A934VQN6_9BACT|nr:UbiA family prenyltransferase [Luteolibacter pohnpeiensis]MBK1882291.1 UbiA family prenyltransferase [Luteolibacter pohnpeiensis]
MKRWWIYQKERFPVVAHAPLIAAFSACAVSFSSLIRGAAPPGPATYGVAFLVCLLMFLQLRIADEFKDADEDARWRPYRPVPRGLVKLSELRLVFIAAAISQLALALWLDPRLLWVLAIAWSYLALMSVEFFCRNWLKKRPVIYLLTHMGIMPLVDFFATACDWMPRSGHAPHGLGWFLTASFCNGVVIEIGRKLRQPEDEEEGVETYSRLWGKRGGVLVWLAALLGTLVSAALAARETGHVLLLSIPLGLAFIGSIPLAIQYVTNSTHGRRIEHFSAIWTLMLYLLLGLIPLAIHHLI